jgi:hypothetical protein
MFLFVLNIRWSNLSKKRKQFVTIVPQGSFASKMQNLRETLFIRLQLMTVSTITNAAARIAAITPTMTHTI